MKDGQKRRHRTEAEIIAALQRSPFITLAAMELGIDPSGLRKRVKRNAKLAAQLEEAQEATADIAEAGLRYHIGQKNLKAIIYYLERKAKDRGYSEYYKISDDDMKRLVGEIAKTSGVEGLNTMKRLICDS